MRACVRVCGSESTCSVFPYQRGYLGLLLTKTTVIPCSVVITPPLLTLTPSPPPNIPVVHGILKVVCFILIPVVTESPSRAKCMADTHLVMGLIMCCLVLSLLWIWSVCVCICLLVCVRDYCCCQIVHIVLQGCWICLSRLKGLHAELCRYICPHMTPDHNIFNNSDNNQSNCCAAVVLLCDWVNGWTFLTETV